MDLLNEDMACIFHHVRRVHRCLSVIQLLGLLQSSNSTAESKPVFIWIMFILEQDLEIEI